MNNVYSVTIRWIDDNTEHDVLLAEYNDTPDDFSDDDIFFYGMSENSIRQAIASGEPCECEWVILKLHGCLTDTPENGKYTNVNLNRYDA